MKICIIATISCSLCLLLGGCHTTRISNQDPPFSQSPSALGPGARTAHFKRGGDWYRLSLLLRSEVERASLGHSIKVVSISELRRFDSTTEDYQQVEGGQRQRLEREFTVAVDSEGQLKLLEGGGTGGTGGKIGVKDVYFESALTIEPSNNATSQSPMIVVATASAKAEHRSRGTVGWPSDGLLLGIAESYLKWRFVLTSDGKIEAIES